MKTLPWIILLALGLAPAGCGRSTPVKPTAADREPPQAANPVRVIDPLKLVLLEQSGESKTDREIRRYQKLVRTETNRELSLERLGWLFVTKARESFDPGYYKFAAACADVLAADQPGSYEALLLHGYVLENLHHFKEAEPIARELATHRGLQFDFGLLGDSLMEQGKLNEAVAAYQSMVNLRPDLESYARVGYIRWLKGDTEGALEMMQLAVDAASPRDANSAAWVTTRLAMLQFQSGKMDEAGSSAAAALVLCSNYPPALLLQGRLQLAQEQAEPALQKIQTAALVNPLPEYLWAQAEALRANGRVPEAQAVEARIKMSGEANDPRTLALFLATRGEDIPWAIQLAQDELRQRQDGFTEDALAWALAADGRMEEAQPHLARALAEGTEDARLFFHAAVIFQKAGNHGASATWFARAAAGSQTLLPSEKTQLLQLADNFTPEKEAGPASVSISEK